MFFCYFIFEVLIHQVIPNTQAKMNCVSPDILGKTANLEITRELRPCNLNSLFPNSP